MAGVAVLALPEELVSIPWRKFWKFDSFKVFTMLWYFGFDMEYNIGMFVFDSSEKWFPLPAVYE